MPIQHIDSPRMLLPSIMLSSLFLLFSTIAFSLRPIGCKYEFTDSSVLKSVSSTSFIRNGQYILIGEDEDTLRFYVWMCQIPQEKDFLLETQMTINWSAEGGGFLIWGADNSNLAYLGLQSISGINNRYWDVGRFIDGKFASEKKSICSEIDIRPGVPNKLAIIKKMDQMQYYVNDDPVYTARYSRPFGDMYGVGVWGKQSVSFDYLTIKELETNKEEKGGENILLKENNGVYVIPAEINNVLKIDFIFDTGASEVTISADVALTLLRTGTIKETDWLEDAHYKLADGSIRKSKRFILRSLIIGKKEVANVTCSISDSIEAPMLLGQSVLSRFGKYSFDYKRKLLVIEE